MGFDELTDDEWAMLAHLFADKPIVSLHPRGRPRAQSRDVANAILWMLTTGRPWTRLPEGSPSIPTCRRRYDEWRESGALDEMLRLLTDAGRMIPRRLQRSSQPAAVSPRDPRGPDSVRAPATPLETACVPAPHRVFWSSPGSWQPPSPSPASNDPEVPAQPFRSKGRLWMGLASHGARVVDERGYVIYAAADVVGDQTFRGWAEITMHGRRVARSGLVGCAFSDMMAAQQYALEWARQWVERDCCARERNHFDDRQTDRDLEHSDAHVGIS
ncbi:transposase [Trinickia violacea]|uniref:transposase n=1 Tax=Trinickia violacea TaxID=2571746 RepID=UPI0020C79E61|nr:transposase [Trinickia violacea]